MKISKFLGINNVALRTQLGLGEMSAATNVDIDGSGALLSRRGRTLLRAGAASCVYEAPFGVFALIAGDLVLLDQNGALLRTVYETLGYSRVWYTKLPDGRVAFSNGLISGLASLTTTTPWGVPTPVDAGAGASGGTLYQINYVRTSDGLEGPPTYGTLIDATRPIDGLPVLAGYTINVYFAPYGEEMFLAGNTGTDTFIPSGAPLGVQYIGSGSLSQPPAGTLLHTWGSRVLIASGKTLWATRPFQPELCDLGRDFVLFPDEITGLFGNNDGIFVGTTGGVYFLEGESFGELRLESIATERMTKGSVVEFDTAYLPSDARPSGPQNAALCLVGGSIHLLHGKGQITGLTTSKYRTSATEVYATTRLRDGVMQYLAAPA